jgi:hypothetical protein
MTQIQQSAYNTYDESLYDCLPPITEEDLGASNAAHASNAAEGRDKLVVRIAAGIPCGIDMYELRIRVGANNMDMSVAEMEVAETNPVAVGRGAREKQSKVATMNPVAVGRGACEKQSKVATTSPVAVGRGTPEKQSKVATTSPVAVGRGARGKQTNVATMSPVAVGRGARGK